MATKQTTNKKKIDSKNKHDFKKECENLKKEIKEINNKLLRVQADFQNYQKRMEKEILFCKQETKEKYLLELLDLYDILSKAYKDNNPKKGLKLLINNLENFFEKEQIKEIDCMGKKFDHNFHHALHAIEKKNCEDDLIIEEVKKGYMINKKVVRPSQVIVVKNKDKKC